MAIVGKKEMYTAIIAIKGNMITYILSKLSCNFLKHKLNEKI